MNENSATLYETEEGQDLRSIDWLLETLVIEANARKSDFIEITLLVQGSIVSGTLVGITEFYKATVGVFHRDDGEPAAGTWGEFFSGLVRSAEEAITSEEGLSKASYIHLKNARVFANGQQPLPSNQGVWWRGRLERVDAFWIGKLKSSDTVA